MTRKKGTDIPDPFILDACTIEWCERRYPRVDLELAVERFTFWASEYTYANWQRAFQNYLVREDNRGDIHFLFKQSREHDPKWAQILAEAKQYGFPPPTAEHPTPAHYRTAFERWKSDQKTSRVLPFENPLRAMK